MCTSRSNMMPTMMNDDAYDDERHANDADHYAKYDANALDNYAKYHHSHALITFITTTT